MRVVIKAQLEAVSDITRKVLVILHEQQDLSLSSSV